MKAKVNLGLAQLSVAAKIEKARQFVIAITNNVSIFATPHPTLVSVGDAADALEVAYNNATDGGKSATAIMHTKESALDDLLTKLGHYVEDTSSGNADSILLAGMDIRHPKNPLTEVPMPVNLEAKTSEVPGEIILHWKPIHNAAAYVIQMNTGSDAWAQIDIVTKANSIAKTLTSGTRYNFRVAAVGSPGTGPFSDSASAMAV